MQAVLFDFFGTLVRYSPSRTDQGYARSGAVLHDAGCPLPDDEWLPLWDTASGELDATAERTGIEYSMHDAYTAFATRAGLDVSDRATRDAFVTTYLEEWSVAVEPIDGVPALVSSLRAAGHVLALVSNTHDAQFLRDQLAASGLERTFDAVIASIDVGVRKPHPEIFGHALRAIGTAPSDALFVGDSLDADFHGARACGIDAYLVAAPDGTHPAIVPANRRLATVLELASVLLPGP